VPSKVCDETEVIHCVKLVYIKADVYMILQRL